MIRVLRSHLILPLEICLGWLFHVIYRRGHLASLALWGLPGVGAGRRDIDALGLSPKLSLGS